MHLIDDKITRLIVDLSNPVTNRSWECVTFKEFLHDYCSQDEQYFYLYCRNLLFRGPQTNNSRASFEAVQYLPVNHVEFIVDHLLQSVESHTLHQVKRVIRDKALEKARELLIVDAGFVLRILLELYREERKDRYLMLKNMFHSISVSVSHNVNFRSFRKIVQSFYPTTSESEIATLFRESYSYGLN